MTNINPEILKIEKILNETIRPAIKRDGGDLNLVSLEGNTLKISYKGACCGCPMATRGTLQAIQSILQEKYDPKLEVRIA